MSYCFGRPIPKRLEDEWRWKWIIISFKGVVLIIYYNLFNQILIISYRVCVYIPVVLFGLVFDIEFLILMMNFKMVFIMLLIFEMCNYNVTKSVSFNWLFQKIMYPPPTPMLRISIVINRTPLISGRFTMTIQKISTFLHWPLLKIYFI